MRTLGLATFAAVALLSGCQSSDPGVRGAGRGAAIGAAGGALVGAVSDVGVVEGAAAGAAVGAVIGAATADGRHYYWEGRRCYYVSDGRRRYVDPDKCD